MFTKWGEEREDSWGFFVHDGSFFGGSSGAGSSPSKIERIIGAFNRIFFNRKSDNK